MESLKNMFSSESVAVSSDPKVQELQQKMATTKANQELLRYSSTLKGGRIRKRKYHTKRKTTKKIKSHKKIYKKKLQKRTKRQRRKSYKNKK